MKTKLFFAAAAVVIMGLSSCSVSTYSHSYRMIEEGLHDKTSVKIADNYEADLDIDFTREIKGVTSKSHKNDKLAKQEAYYNALTSNGVHVIVNPIYKVSQVGEDFDCEVVGFGAKYKNPRASNSSSDVNTQTSTSDIDDRLAQLERFSKIQGVQAGLRKSSYLVDSRDGCCDDKKSGESDYGDTHLLHAIDNTSSLVDEFLKFISYNASPEVKVEKQKFSLFK